MSEIDPIREYSKFEDARALLSDVGSATDVRFVDVVAAGDEGWTASHVTRRAFEQQHPIFRETPKAAEDASTIGSLNIDMFAVGTDEAPNVVNMGSFATLDHMRTPEGQIQRQINGLRIGSPLIYRERLGRRLEFVLEAMEEEDATWSELSSQSLHRMLSFLSSAPELRCPVVTVTPSATFRAQWTAGPIAHFAVDFLPDGKARFVVFCPDPRHPERVQRVSGTTSWENLMNAVESYNIRRWAADAWT